MSSSTFRCSPLFLCALVVALGLSGCGYKLYTHAKPDIAENAANVYVSAYPAVPWGDIREKLEPKNNLSIEDARKMATQTTQSEVFQFITTLAASLGIGLPVKTDTLKPGYGAVPTDVTTPQTEPKMSPFTPDLSKLGIDGSTLLTAGTALYQQAQILDNQISKSIEPEGYRAHLITLQVNIQPRQRNVSYDAYVDVSFLPGTWEQSLESSRNKDGRVEGYPPVIIYPLVITDAMETTSVGRTIEAIRQAALQLSGTIGSVGVSGGAGAGAAKSESVVGIDKNSLVTLGRISDHTARIRLGAINSGSAGLALVPRTYNVSLVALTRWWKSNNEEKRIKSLRAITHTVLVSTEDGSVLETGRKRLNLANRVAKIACLYKYCGTTDKICNPPSSVLEKTDRELTESEEERLDLLQAVDYGDYSHIYEKLQNVNFCQDKKGRSSAKMPEEEKSKPPDKLTPEEEIRIYRFLAEMMEIQADTRFANLRIQLQDLHNPELPDPDQYALYSDDKKSITSFVLLGGRQLHPRDFQAWLWVQDKDQQDGPTETKKLVASPSITNGGAKIEINFPSLAKSNLVPATSTPLSLVNIYDSKQTRYSVKATSEEEPVKNPVTASSAMLVGDHNNVARVTLLVGKYPESTKIAPPLRLKVEGADIRANPTISTTPFTNKGVELKAESVVTLELGNLSPANLVTLTTMDSKDNAIGKPIIFTVDRTANTEK